MQKTTMTPTFLAGQLFARLAISCMTRPGWELWATAAIAMDVYARGEREGNESL